MQSVGDHLGVSAQAVASWEKDTHNPTLPNLLGFAQLTAVNVAWILTGVGNEEGRQDGEFFPAGGPGRAVPKLQYNQIGQWLDGTLADVADKAMSHYQCGPRAFQLPVADRSNEPRYMPGDSLIVDPDQIPDPGDMVVANLGGRIIVRKFRPHANVIELVPLNGDWPVESFDSSQSDIVLGTVTEHSQPRR